MSCDRPAFAVLSGSVLCSVWPARGFRCRFVALVLGWLAPGTSPASAAESAQAAPEPVPAAPGASEDLEPDVPKRGAPSFELDARVISGFEIQRERPSGAQTRPGENDFGFELRQARVQLKSELDRFRLELSLELSDALSSDISGYDSPPFLRDASLEYHYSRALRLQVGRYKRPLSRIELQSSAELPVIRRGLLNGLLVEDNQWGDRALGAMVSGRLELAKLRWYLSLSNPNWSTSLQSRGLDVIGRVQLSPAKGWTLGVDGGYKALRLGSEGQWTHNFAAGGDVAWKLGDAHVLVEGHFGDLPFETASPQGFGVLALIDYELGLSESWALQPVLFGELADADAELSQTESARLALGINLLERGGFRLLPQVALVRPLGRASQQNPWLASETYSLIFSLAL
ncbi:MAG TPA: porin [Polyangiaceae bacterium]|nr:porin [Polyangiaceae bacterium]